MSRCSNTEFCQYPSFLNLAFLCHLGWLWYGKWNAKNSKLFHPYILPCHLSLPVGWLVNGGIVACEVIKIQTNVACHFLFHGTVEVMDLFWEFDVDWKSTLLSTSDILYEWACDFHLSSISCACFTERVLRKSFLVMHHYHSMWNISQKFLFCFYVCWGPGMEIPGCTGYTPCLGNLCQLAGCVNVSSLRVLFIQTFSVYRSRCYFDPLQFNELRIHCKPCFYVDPLQFFC